MALKIRDDPFPIKAWLAMACDRYFDSAQSGFVLVCFIASVFDLLYRCL